MLIVEFRLIVRRCGSVSRRTPTGEHEESTLCAGMLPKRVDYILIGFTFFLTFGTFTNCYKETRCDSLTVRREDGLEKLRNCTVIMGYLEIYRLPINISDVHLYSFPKLTEITGYLTLFYVNNITSVSELFPNLKSIKGVKTYKGYSLVIFRLEDLEEIGLYSLIHINGTIRIGACNKLCYVDTVNWKELGAEGIERDSELPAHCNNCSDRCKEGHCWSEHQCQKRMASNCHPECLGCTKENSPEHCEVCKHWKDDDTCVSECPKNKYKHEYSQRCLTLKECQNMVFTDVDYKNISIWWTFNNSCIFKCPPKHIYDLKAGCLYCEDCEYLCEGQATTDRVSLREMERCTYINGSLIINNLRNVGMEDLEKYLGSIRHIRGFLKIGRTQTIQSLSFFKDLRTIEGGELDSQNYSLYIYENMNLQKLLDPNSTLTIKNGRVAFHNNPQLCINEIENFLNVIEIQSNLTQNDRAIIHTSNGDSPFCNIYQLNITIVEVNATDITIEWIENGNSQSDNIFSTTIYYTEAEQDLKNDENVCGVNIWFAKTVESNRAQLTDLKPYTRYVYYIQIYTKKISKTNYYYFKTKSDDPSKITGFVAKPDETYMMLFWVPPSQPNGQFDYYELVVVLENDYNRTIDQRNYCISPHEKTISNETTLMNETDETRIFRQDIMTLCARNSVQKSCSRLSYEIDDYGKTYETEHVKFGLTSESSRKEDSLVFNRTFKILPNETSFMVNQLKHFRMYIFFLKVCNKPDGPRQPCSPVEMAFSRTLPKKSADDVSSVKVDIEGHNVLITWVEPSDPNAVIVSYHIEHKRLDIEHPKPIQECTKRELFKTHFPNSYKLSNLPSGTYSVRVRAVSLAGEGQFSKPIVFEILSTNTTSVWLNIFLSLLFILIGIAVAITIYRWYRKKYLIDDIHLITTINPDYAGPIYKEDEWEIDVDDIQILQLLGEGTFGNVHQGLIKSRNQLCAIKTMNQTSLVDKMEFLNEGSVMKSFNGSNHVIKLLGVVSRGNCPMVIMELMERGDLKSYLRRCREPSQNLTMNEVYRMAAEIADGMAYLSAKKFVHRDLAARNCMVAGDRTVKIGDFGMARDVYVNDYYRKETKGLLPVRWMAPESLADGVFTSDSDVWSYGVVLWEMATLAEQPYQGLSNEEVLSFIKNRGTLSRPVECSDLLYEVMSACWKWRPMSRPTFFNIVDKLSNHVGEGFRLVAFCYSKEGQDYILNAGPRPYNPPAMSVAPEGDGVYLHYDAAQEEVGLFTDDKNRPNEFYSNQRYRRPSPQQISPGSPTSAFSIESA